MNGPQRQLVNVLNDIADALNDFRNPGKDKHEAMRRALDSSCVGLRVVVETGWDVPSQNPDDVEELLGDVLRVWRKAGLSDRAIAQLVDLAMDAYARDDPEDPPAQPAVIALRDRVCMEAERREEKIRNQARRYRLVKIAMRVIVTAARFGL